MLAIRSAMKITYVERNGRRYAYTYVSARVPGRNPEQVEEGYRSMCRDTAFFARLAREDVALNGWELSCAGSASLATSAQTEDKGAVAVQNCESSIASALNEGLTIQKLAMTAVPADNPDASLSFAQDTSMTVSGLKLPRAEKGADADTDFLLKADTCARAADLALHIAGLA